MNGFYRKKKFNPVNNVKTALQIDLLITRYREHVGFRSVRRKNFFRHYIPALGVKYYVLQKRICMLNFMEKYLFACNFH